jgi:hypothetical protein
MVAKGYVSDFTNFMNQYLGEHPAVVEEQRLCAGVLAQGETRPDGSAVNPPQLTVPAEPVAPREPRRFFKRLRGWRGR